MFENSSNFSNIWEFDFEVIIVLTKSLHKFIEILSNAINLFIQLFIIYNKWVDFYGLPFTKFSIPGNNEFGSLRVAKNNLLQSSDYLWNYS